ncbi:PAN domain-containing protein [Hyphomonas pacifica]|nr:PAN domain-containing protein [Hyphomonas pacifica]
MRPFPTMLILACLAIPVATATAAPAGEQETGIYRLGGTYDYSFTETEDACEAICAADEACVAWSFVKSNSADNSRCELKDTVGAAQRNPFATSGKSAASASGVSTDSASTISGIGEQPREELAGGPLPSTSDPRPH